MTDNDVLTGAISCLAAPTASLCLVRRNGDVLLGLPRQREAAERTLQLYQPQRPAARILVFVLRRLVKSGLHRFLLPRIRLTEKEIPTLPSMPGIDNDSLGILLGSPEHATRRAIACYRIAGTWEVAKISFGAAGAENLEQESLVLNELKPIAPGIPDSSGLHRGAGVTVLRMAYLSGTPLPPGEPEEVIGLLDSWIRPAPPKPITKFSEWPAIFSALSQTQPNSAPWKALSTQILRPVIRHGDFARWNLLRKSDGSLAVLDWEWGHSEGLPGIDLVHYVLQDARLVKVLSHADAIETTRKALRSPACRAYLDATGWDGDPILPIIACLAFKQGARHQENREILNTAVAALQRGDSAIL